MDEHKDRKTLGLMVAMLMSVQGIIVGLKLALIVKWKWLWVFSPLWVTVGVVVLMVLGYTIAVRIGRKRRKG